MRILISVMERKFEGIKAPSRVTSQARFIATLLLIGVIGVHESQAECMKARDGFKCTATESSSSRDFKVSLTNNGSEDIKIDVFKRVGTCNKPPKDRSHGPPQLTNLPASRRFSESIEKSSLDPEGGGSYDKDLVVSRNGKLSIGLDKGPAPYCSISIIRNCRDSSNNRVDCASVLKAD